MLVKEAIELLQENLDPEGEIIFAYWTHEDYFDHLDEKEWHALCAAEDEINWSFAWESIQFVADNMNSEEEVTNE